MLAEYFRHISNPPDSRRKTKTAAFSCLRRTEFTPFRVCQMVQSSEIVAFFDGKAFDHSTVRCYPAGSFGESKFYLTNQNWLLSSSDGSNPCINEIVIGGLLRWLNFW
jgi:hypothetical protein